MSRRKIEIIGSLDEAGQPIPVSLTRDHEASMPVIGVPKSPYSPDENPSEKIPEDVFDQAATEEDFDTQEDREPNGRQRVGHRLAATILTGTIAAGAGYTVGEMSDPSDDPNVRVVYEQPRPISDFEDKYVEFEPIEPGEVIISPKNPGEFIDVPNHDPVPSSEDNLSNPAPPIDDPYPPEPEEPPEPPEDPMPLDEYLEERPLKEPPSEEPPIPPENPMELPGDR